MELQHQLATATNRNGGWGYDLMRMYKGCFGSEDHRSFSNQRRRTLISGPVGNAPRNGPDQGLGGISEAVTPESICHEAHRCALVSRSKELVLYVSIASLNIAALTVKILSYACMRSVTSQCSQAESASVSRCCLANRREHHIRPTIQISSWHRIVKLVRLTSLKSCGRRDHKSSL